MIPISVCIIAKNEEKNIENCLKPLKNFPFEIIVADTGSTDNTKEIAGKYADKVLDFTWVNDFSAARNFSIEQASHDWILVLDCDEFLNSLDFDVMQQMMADYPYAIGQLTRDNICYDQYHHTMHSTDLVERLFDRRLFHYTGRIHEQVTPLEKGELYGFQFPLYVTHVGYVGSEEDIEAKAMRNINLLLEDLKENDQDPYTYYQLGEAFQLKNDYETAFQYFDRGFYLEVDENLEYVKRMMVSYGHCMLKTGRQEQALTLTGVYEAFCDVADFVFLMGIIYMRNKKYNEAVAEFKKATTIEFHFDEGVNSYLAYHNLGCIYEGAQQFETAYYYFRQAGDYEPSLERLKKYEVTT